MTDYITIDPGLACTTTWVAEMDRAFTITTSDKDTRQRRLLVLTRDLHKLMLFVTDTVKVKVAVIEQYAFSPAVTRSITMLAEAGGVIRLTLETFKLPTVEMPIGTWKSLAMGSKFVKQKKNAEYLRRVEEKWKRRFMTYDLADAFLMSRAVEKLIVGGKLTTAQEIIRRQLVGLIQPVSGKVLSFADGKEEAM